MLLWRYRGSAPQQEPQIATTKTNPLEWGSKVFGFQIEHPKRRNLGQFKNKEQTKQNETRQEYKNQNEHDTGQVNNVRKFEETCNQHTDRDEQSSI